MDKKTNKTARPVLAGLIVLALMAFGGCSGPATEANTGETSTVSSPPPAAQLTLQGSPPASVTAGTLYSFQPSVSPNPAGVTFAINKKPAWANFDSSTGALRGTPSVGNEGTTANIMITASNSSSTASLGPFAIVVDAPAGSQPPATGTATLTWVAPTENVDGTVLVNLVGYHIYYGTDANDMTQEIDVQGADSTSYVVDGLAPGTYYFAVTAYSSSGNESTDSDVGSKTI